jgi:hypothetical protein
LNEKPNGARHSVARRLSGPPRACGGAREFGARFIDAPELEQPVAAGPKAIDTATARFTPALASPR